MELDEYGCVVVMCLINGLFVNCKEIFFIVDGVEDGVVKVDFFVVLICYDGK